MVDKKPKVKLPVVSLDDPALLPENRQDACKPAHCEGCALYKKKCMVGEGASGHVDIMMLSESPSSWSVNNRAMFYGRGGRIIRTAWRDLRELDNKSGGKLKMAHLKRWDAYAVQCQVEEGRDQSATANASTIQRCSSFLHAKIKNAQPKIILAFGATALKSLGFKSERFMEVRGRLLDVEIGGQSYKVLPTFSTKHMVAKTGLYNLFYSDFVRAIRIAGGADEVGADTTIEELTKDYWIPKTVAEVGLLCDHIISHVVEGAKEAAQCAVAVDVETNTLNPHRKDAKVLCVSFAWDTGRAGAIPLFHRETPWTAEELPVVIAHVRRVLECAKPKVFHNAKFDLKFLELRHGWRVNNVQWDSLLGEHLLREDMTGSYGLKILGRTYFPMFGNYADKVQELAEQLTPEEAGQHAALEGVKKGKPKKSVVGIEDGLLYELSKKEVEHAVFGTKRERKKQVFDAGYERVQIDLLLLYAAIDTDLTRRLLRHQFGRMKAEGFHANARSLMQTHCVPASRALGKMEFDGFRVDRPYLDKLEVDLAKVVEKKRKLLEIQWQGTKHPEQVPTTLCARGIEFNPNSTEHIAHVLFDQGVFEGDGKRVTRHAFAERNLKSQKRKTDKKTLKAIAEKVRCPFAKALLEYRAAHKALTGFVKDIKDLSAYDGYLHTNFHLHGTSTGRTSSSNINCFDAQTEILTEQGWVAFPDLLEGLRVAQWHEDGHVDFTAPTAYIARPHVGDMVAIRNQHIDLLLTEDHRCLLRTESDKLRVVAAEDYPGSAKQIHAGSYDGGPGLPLTDDELRLVVATQADGHWIGKQIEFGLRKPRKIARLTQLLKRTGAEFRPSEHGDGRARIWVRGDVRDRVHTYLGDAKQWGPWLLQATRAQLDVIVAETMFWDGCPTRASMYSSSDEVNVDWMQIAHVLSGVRANKRAYDNKNPNARLNYQLDVTRRDYSWTTNRTRELVPYDGTVYCVSVPSSYVIVRRNGKVVVTGQCQNIPKKLSGVNIKKIFVADDPDEEVVFNVDWKGAEIRVFTAYAPDEQLIKALNDGLDVHSWFTQEIFGIPYAEVEARKDVDHEMGQTRTTVKRVVFGILYGAMAKKIAETAGISEERAQEVIDKLFERFPSLKNYMDEVVSQIHAKGFVETLFGRRRRFPLQGVNGFFRGQAERRGKNMKIQSTSSDIVIAQLIEIFEHIAELGGRLCITVHDSIVGCMKKKFLPQAAAFFDYYCVQRVREKYAWLPVDFAYDIGVGESYGETISLADWLKKNPPVPQTQEQEFMELLDQDALNDLVDNDEDHKKADSMFAADEDEEEAQVS